ncbi:MFS transporter [Amycolatopsis sp. NBC_01480]|uniref:MFS transporter n=1 Tax=Amycolatopsis sp. NBC_01480 TaxID=2903562 RepID=UPI002E2C3F47|nr:MFS transporter [Amycolatopsis sp. NBC_01480]
MVLSPLMDENRRVRRNIRLGSLGAALENYDFVVYLYVATLIGAAFFPSGTDTLRLAQTLAIYAIGFLIRPVAGVLIARVADRVGRKRLFVINVMVMSAATLVTGLLPTYAQVGWPAPILLMIMRVAQGCAVGGELPAAAVFVSEHAHRGGVAKAGAFQQAMTFVGLLFGASAAFGSSLLATHLTPGTPSLAWRLPFIIGGVLGIVSVYLRRNLDESPAFQQQSRQPRRTQPRPVRDVLKNHGGAVLFGALVVSGLAVANIAYITFWPTYLQVSVHLSATEALAASLISVVGALVMMPFWGRVADRHGWRFVLLWAAGVTATGTVLLLAVLPGLPRGSSIALWIGLPAAVGAGAIISVVPGLVSSVFPAEVRQTGYSLSYNLVIAILGGLLTLAMVGLLSALGSGAPMYVGFLACVITVLAAALVSKIPLYLGRGVEQAASDTTGEVLAQEGKTP